ncbi:MAG: cysteine desulfurase [Bacteroidetes bacterium]|nr:cysteine desulfurase [Bacteroidia bacterium]PCH64706.1 MAG: cysteine desulfurase [Bacteroidota bacterium]
MKIYFDNAATTQLDPVVKKEMISAMDKFSGNPSSIHSFGREAKTEVEKSRKKVAEILAASPSEIFFTSGGTEANNTIINGVVNSLGIKKVISSPIEHPSIWVTLQRLSESGDIELEYVDLDNNGHVDLNSLEKYLKNNPNSFVSLMHANNEIGNLTSIKKVGELCKEYKAIYHADTVQTVGKYHIDLQTVNVDFITSSAHKLHGPKGVGFFYMKGSDTSIKSFITGGAQERNMRGGTENTYGIVGLAKALEIAVSDLDNIQSQIKALKEYMLNELRANFETLSFNGDVENKSLFNLINVGFTLNDVKEITPDKLDMLLFNLDIEGVAVSGGSACSSGSLVGSHVLKALNVDDNKLSIRFSFSKFNTKEEIDTVISILKIILQ